MTSSQELVLILFIIMNRFNEVIFQGGFIQTRDYLPRVYPVHTQLNQFMSLYICGFLRINLVLDSFTWVGQTSVY